MYTHSFSNYLLENKYVKAIDLAHALSDAKKITLSLPVITIYTNALTAKEVEYLQERASEHGSFQEAALHYGYFTEDEIASMLACSYPDFLLFSEILLEKSQISYSQFEEALVNYQSDTEIYEAEANTPFVEKTDIIINKIVKLLEPSDAKYPELYFKLLFNHLLKYIGDDFTVLDPFICPEYPTNVLIAQTVQADDFHYVSAIDMDVNSALEFASRYAQESYTKENDYVRASIEDFLNLLNGVFNVNLSNEYSKEVKLNPPVTYRNEVLSIGKDTCLLPILFPFGTIMFLLASITV